jgi:molecular chaperone GrpE
VSICRFSAVGNIFDKAEIPKVCKSMTDKRLPDEELSSGVGSAGKEQEENADNRASDVDPAEKEKVKDEEKTHRDHPKIKKEKLQERIAELENALLEIADRHLRLQAEFDNFRKRTLKEKAELIKSGGETVLTTILPIIDDFDRALTTMKEVPEEDPAKIGFNLIFSKFRDFLKQNNIKEIEAGGTDFNVDLHFALTKIPAPAEELKGKVVDVIEKGYLLNDKVLRFAKVVIGE